MRVKRELWFLLILAAVLLLNVGYDVATAVRVLRVLKSGPTGIPIAIPEVLNPLRLAWGVALYAGGVFLELLPYFAGGVILGGFLIEFVSREKLQKWMGRGGPTSILIATGAGCAVPVCSCGIVPVVAGLVQSELPLGPVIAFLIAAPMLNPVTLAMTAGMISLKMAIARVIAVAAISMATGLVVRRLLRTGWLRDPIRLFVPPKLTPQQQQLAMQVGMALANAPDGLTTGELEAQLRRPLAEALGVFERGRLVQHASDRWTLVQRDMDEYQHACFVMADEGEVGAPLGRRVGNAFRLSWASLLGLAKYILVAVLIAGAIRVFLPDALVLRWVGGVTIHSVFLAAVIATFLYICTCSDVPMVQALVSKGMGGGAALAFLLGGPGMSLPSLAMLSSVFKRRLLAVYFVVSLVGCIIAGYVYNLL